MNKEDIKRMAIEARWDAHQSDFDTRIKTFAALVAFAEREACAKIGDDHPSWSSRMYSATIRARDKQDGECKLCTDGCPACDATKLTKEAHDLL